MKASLAIAAEIREQIARGELSPGDLLPVESDLMDDFGVSKGVVREALRILETEGFVEVRRGLGGGPRVLHPSISQVTMNMGIYLQIGEVQVMDVWAARDRIVGGAVERLALKHDKDDVANLMKVVERLVGAVGDFDAYYLQLLDVDETAVDLAGSATEHLLVVALRHIIATEFEAATRAIVDVHIANSVVFARQFENVVAEAWTEATRHIRMGHVAAARRAYERQAELIRSAMSQYLEGSMFVDVFSD